MWLEALRDLKKYFAHQELWIIEMQPVVNFNPNIGEGSPTHQEIVATGIHQTAYGESALVMPKLEPKMLSRGGLNPAYTEPMINAVKVKGYWRGGSNGIVLTQLLELIENSEVFGKEISSKSGNIMKPVTLTEPDLVVENATSAANDKLGAPFTVIVPLNHPILIK
jgi:hypothetical protein